MKIKKLLFSIALVLTIICSNTNGGILLNQIQAAVKIEESAFNYIKEIDKNYPKRIAGSDIEKQTADYIKGELESFGYEVTTQDFEYIKKSTTYHSQNIIAIKHGKSDQQIILGSHYDSVNTNGAGDNASGVGVNLASAKEMANKNNDYTIVFIFFGAEEAGLQGSKAYVNNMSSEEIAKTILMINLDSLLAGTYTYIYGGYVNDGEVIDTWGVDQGLELSEELGLPLITNDTELNYDYPTPTTGNWSDHAPFKNVGISHIYLEASNWEVLDNPSKPEEGSSGAAESEIGVIMHTGKDSIEFIEQQWPERSKHNIKVFSNFLAEYLLRVDPAGLKAKELEKNKKVTKGKYTYYYVLNKNNKYDLVKKVKKDNNVVITYKYKNNKLVKYQKNTYKNSKLITKFIKIYGNTKLTNSYKYTYNKKNKISTKILKNYKKTKLTNVNKYKLNKNNKLINTYSQKKVYYSNNKIKINKITYKNLNNKVKKTSVLTYNKKSYKDKKVIAYYQNHLIKKITYLYNKKGQLKSNSYGVATKYTQEYNKHEYVSFWQIKVYNNAGKLV